MNILFFTRLFYPHVGGVEKHVFEISKRLIQDGHTVSVITEDINGKPKETYQGIHIYRIPVGTHEKLKKFTVWFWLLTHTSLLAQADIVHCHDIFIWYLPFRFLYFKKPVYTTFHGYEMIFPPAQNAIIIRKISQLLSWGNICVGKYITKWYHTKPTIIIDGAIDSSEHTSRKKFHTIPKILFIGRLEEDTGVPLYLRMLDILQARNCPYVFEVCGDGSWRESVKKYGTVHGFVQSVSDYLSQTDIVFASSHLSIMQALSYKKIVLATYTNQLKKDALEMATFGSWIKLSSDPYDLADFFQQVIADPSVFTPTVEKAYTWVHQQTWEHLLSAYYQLWNQNKKREKLL